MRIYTPMNIGSVQLFTRTEGNVPLLEESMMCHLSCVGKEIIVGEPQCIRVHENDQDGLMVVRITDDIPEDGYYVEARHFGIG